MNDAWDVLCIQYNIPDSKVHGANMEPIWGRQDQGGPHVGRHISGMVGPIDVKQKGSALVEYWIQCVTLTLDVSRSNFEIALSQELLV